MHTAVADDDNDLSVSLLSSGWYTLRTHCDTLHKSKRAVVAVCARSAASWRRALSKLGAAAASATEHDDVKTVKPAVAAASCAFVAAAAGQRDEGVRSGARERCSPDPREARGVGGAAAPHPAVVRPQELGA